MSRTNSFVNISYSVRANKGSNLTSSTIVDDKISSQSLKYKARVISKRAWLIIVDRINSVIVDLNNLTVQFILWKNVYGKHKI